jgi:Rrf2 family protein
LSETGEGLYKNNKKITGTGKNITFIKQYNNVLFMIFSKSCSYALRVLMFMADKPDEVHTAPELYENLNIPNRYLRRVLTRLAKSGFIRSVRGIGGGFTFQKPIDAIYLSEVIDHFEGMDTFRDCVLGVADCKVSPHCNMHILWEETQKKILETFSHTTLQMLIANPGLLAGQSVKNL